MTDRVVGKSEPGRERTYTQTAAAYCPAWVRRGVLEFGDGPSQGTGDPWPFCDTIQYLSLEVAVLDCGRYFTASGWKHSHSGVVTAAVVLISSGWSRCAPFVMAEFSFLFFKQQILVFVSGVE